MRTDKILSRKIFFTERILELDQGEWEGKKRAEIYTPEQLIAINSNNWNFTPPKGESQRMVEERMLQWLESTFSLDYEKESFHHVAVFTHGFAIKCMLRGIMGWHSKMTYKTQLGNTSISRLTYEENGWNLHSINDLAHLITF